MPFRFGPCKPYCTCACQYVLIVQLEYPPAGISWSATLNGHYYPAQPAQFGPASIISDTLLTQGDAQFMQYLVPENYAWVSPGPSPSPSHFYAPGGNTVSVTVVGGAGGTTLASPLVANWFVYIISTDPAPKGVLCWPVAVASGSFAFAGDAVGGNQVPRDGVAYTQVPGSGLADPCKYAPWACWDYAWVTAMSGYCGENRMPRSTGSGAFRGPSSS
jgi:hypothetical protein